MFMYQTTVVSEVPRNNSNKHLYMYLQPNFVGKLVCRLQRHPETIGDKTAIKVLRFTTYVIVMRSSFAFVILTPVNIK